MKFIFFVGIVCMSIIGCDLKLSNTVWNNVAEIAEFVVCGEVDNISVSLMCGRREVSYSLDGVANQLIPYGIITVFVPEDMVVENINYTIFVGVDKFEGVMEKNPYDNSWAADIKTMVNKNENISIDLYCNGAKYSTKLKLIDDNWIISTNEIIDKILIADYKEQVKSFIKDGKFAAEVFVKLINDRDNGNSQYYCFVSIQGRDDNTISILVSPQTAEVLASSLISVEDY